MLPEYMPIEAHCQGNRGINAVNRLKLGAKYWHNLVTWKNEKIAHEYLTQTYDYKQLDFTVIKCYNQNAKTVNQILIKRGR